MVDANILFSALIVENVAHRLFFEEEFELYAPEYLLEEFADHRNEILKKSRRTEMEFDRAMKIMVSRMRMVPLAEFAAFMDQAIRMSPDKDDAVYFAVALAIGGAIWSNDKALKSQQNVKVYSTQELLQMQG
ncbi:MAG: PIN domain-containing protein [Candidatus Anstonellaceae archaeon]